MGDETGGNVECTEVMPADAAPPQLLLNHGLCGDASMVHARHPQRGPPAHAVPPGQRVLRQRLCPQSSGRLKPQRADHPWPAAAVMSARLQKGSHPHSSLCSADRVRVKPIGSMVSQP